MNLKDNEEYQILERALQRERSARKKAEALLENKSRDLYNLEQNLEQKKIILNNRIQEVEFLGWISAFLNSELDNDEILQMFLQETVSQFGVKVAHLLKPSPHKTQSLISSKIWAFENEEKFLEFKKISELITFNEGEGLPGRVFFNKNSFWIEDLSKDLNFPRFNKMNEKTLWAGFAIPFLGKESVLAVAEFFYTEITPVDEQLMSVLQSGANHLAVIIENKNIQRKLRINNHKLEKTLNSLKETQAQLFQSEKLASLGTLAAGVAHEINNPLGYISSNVKTLSEYFKEIKEQFVKEELDKNKILKEIFHDLPELIQETMDGIRRVQDIVLDLKGFVRLDELQVKSVNINECIELTLKVIFNETKYKAKIIKEFGVLPEIYCYAGQINQVFLNLIVNSVQSFKKNGIIKIKTFFKEDYVSVEIIDNGQGISKENINKIFNPFFTTKKIGQGTGLGLSVVYNIIQNHGGVIFVNSVEGKGTKFTIKLPVTGFCEIENTARENK